MININNIYIRIKNVNQTFNKNNNFKHKIYPKKIINMMNLKNKLINLQK